MPNLTSVGITSGVPSSGTGTVSTIDQLLAVGLPISNGSSSVMVAITGTTSAPTSSMSALVVGLSPNSVNANGQATMANSAPVVIASNQSAVAISISSAVNTVWNSGTSFNGQFVTPITLVSSEAVALGSSVLTIGTSTTTLTASGIWSSSSTGQAILGEVFVTIGTTIATATGGNLAGWFLQSFDGGTTFESTTYTPISRPPDFVIPVTSATIGASTPYKAMGPVNLPALQFKTAIQNNLGVALGTSAVGYPVVKLLPLAQQGG